MVTTPANTLHLLAVAPSHWLNLIPQISAVWQKGDLLFLIAEAAQGFNHSLIQTFDHIAILDKDLARLEVATIEIPNQIKIAATSDWAMWTIEYPRSITWR